MEKSPSRWWDFPSAALFVLAILFSAWRLTVTDWTEDLGAVTNLALAGAIVGLALGASRFGKRGVRWLAWGYTLALLPRQLIAAYYARDVYLGERLAGLGGRLLYSLSEFAADRPVEDPLFFLALIGALYWSVALVSGYQLARHNNTLAAILPAGLVMLVIHHFDRAAPNRLWLVAMYLFAALALLARGKYLRDRTAWTRRGVHLSPEAGPDLTMGAMIGAAALILLAWSLPLDLSRAPLLEEKWKEATRPWRATRDRLSRAFEALEGPGAVERAETFRRTLQLGNQAAQGNELVMLVRVPLEALDLPRLYWRARIYDRYENGEWSLSETAGGKFSPDDEGLPIPDLAARNQYEFAFTSYTRGQAVLALPSQPLWVSRPVDVTFFPLAEGGQDVIVLESFPYLEPGETYRARAAIANPSIEELRAAGEEYPAWVTERYLQLPADFSERMRAFASSVTFGLETPYDKAQAVTTVLRAQIEYQPSLPLPPEGADALEWFLFEIKQGYCNYYASAEVLLLRSLGIPARLAAGFAQGEAVEDARRLGETETFIQQYSVAAKHLHAWPEVYFPGIGWVEFEPTMNQDPLQRPETHRADLEPAAPPTSQPPRGPAALLDEEDAPTAQPAAQGFDWKPWLAALLWVAGFAAAAAAWMFANRRYTLTTRAAEYALAAAEKRGERFPAWLRNAALSALASPFERAFHPVNVILRWLGQPPAAHLTPAERAAALKPLLPGAEEEIEVLLKEYQSAQYARRGGDLRAARRASRRVLWQGLRAALRRAWE